MASQLLLLFASPAPVPMTSVAISSSSPRPYNHGVAHSSIRKEMRYVTAAPATAITSQTP